MSTDNAINLNALLDIKDGLKLMVFLDKFGITYNDLFLLCVDMGKIEWVKYLLENGADPNCINHSSIPYDHFDITPLHKAVKVSPRMVKLLIDYGADVNAGGDVNTRDNSNVTCGDDEEEIDYPTALYVAASNTRNIYKPNIVRIIDTLLDNGAIIDREYDEESPLEAAVIFGNYKAVKRLVERGANFAPTRLLELERFSSEKKIKHTTKMIKKLHHKQLIKNNSNAKHLPKQLIKNNSNAKHLPKTRGGASCPF